MKNQKTFLLILIGGICASLFIAGCSSPQNRKWLNFFFDGVPAPNSGTNAVAANTSNAGTNAVSEQPVKSAPAPAQPFYFGHPPFVEQKCSSCHESQMGQGMRKKTPELCFDCHKDFLATAKVKHQPVESGDCKSCHDPHQSFT